METPTAEEVALATRFIGALSKAFDPQKYHDEYREQLTVLIRAKAEGQQVVRPAAAPAPAKVINLMDALRQSVEMVKKPLAKAAAAGRETAQDRRVEPARRTARARRRPTASAPRAPPKRRPFSVQFRSAGLSSFLADLIAYRLSGGRGNPAIVERVWERESRLDVVGDSVGTWKAKVEALFSILEKDHAGDYREALHHVHMKSLPPAVEQAYQSALQDPSLQNWLRLKSAMIENPPHGHR